MSHPICVSLMGSAGTKELAVAAHGHKISGLGNIQIWVQLTPNRAPSTTSHMKQ